MAESGIRSGVVGLHGRRYCAGLLAAAALALGAATCHPPDDGRGGYILQVEARTADGTPIPVDLEVNGMHVKSWEAGDEGCVVLRLLPDDAIALVNADTGDYIEPVFVGEWDEAARAWCAERHGS